MSSNSELSCTSLTSTPANYLPAVTIELLSNTSSDRRTITLQPDQIVQIGRASRSEVKNLQPADDNALFDCPVVSRQHAEIRLSSWQPKSDQVTITDLTSLHGTTVNGHRLEAGKKFTLQSGDVIKLGERVTRGDGTCMSDPTTQSSNTPANYLTTDTHDGVSITYTRLEAMTDSYRPPSPTGNSYRCPSEQEDSEYESDIQSIHSFAKDKFSANTTPEDNKLKLGSQSEPIFLAESPIAVVDVSDEESDNEAMHLNKRSAQLRVIPDTCDDIESLVADDDQPNGSFLDEDEGEGSHYDSDEDNAFDDSAAFDDEDADRISEADSEPESVLYTDDRNPDIVFTSSAAAATGAPQLLGNIRKEVLVPQPVEEGSAPSTSKPRYDPVRSNSQAPVESAATGSAVTASAKPAPYKRVYTSRWDMRPPQHPAFQTNNNFMSSYKPAPMQSAFVDYLNAPSYTPMFDSGSMSANNWGAMSPQHLAPLDNFMAQPEIPATTPTANTGKFSINSLIDAQIEGQDDVQPEQGPSVTGNKRKASEMEAEETVEGATEAPEPLAKQQKAEATTTTASTSRRQRRRAHHPGPLRKIATETAKYSGAAFLGAAATVAFLISPAAQWLIENLN